MRYPFMSDPRRRSWGPALLLGLLLSLILGACREGAPVFTSRFQAFGSQVDLSLVRVTPEQAERATAAIRRDFDFMERAWHAWEPGPMGRVNQLLPTGRPFVAPPSVMPLVRLSQTYAQQSGGLFNPAIGHLVDLWGFHTEIPECNPPPSEKSIQRLVKANPQMSEIHIEGLELTGTNPALRLDLSALAKGYAIDQAIGYLRELGVRDAQVQIGGYLRAIGERSGQPWRVPIRRPSGSGVLAVVQVRGDEGVATAATYDRNFIYGGTTYHSVLDPRTGWPAQDSLAVTVVHGDTATATAAATALFVAGPGQWHRVARAMGVRYVMLVDSRGSIHMNPEMRERIDLVDERADLVISAPLMPAQPASGTGYPGVSPAPGS